MVLPPVLYERLTGRNRLLTLSRPLAAVVLFWRLRRQRRDEERTGIDRLDRIVVINLAKRADRLAQFEAEMRQLRIRDYQRFEAIEDSMGALGCALSHIACLRQFVDESLDCMMVCEDDAHFLVTREELDVLVQAFLADDEAEIACLAYNNLRPPTRHSRLFVRAPAPTMTTCCYLVKSSIAADLADCFDEGAQGLAEGGDLRIFQIDSAWSRLQRSRVFVLPIKRAVCQADGYSDVAGRFVAYGGH